MPTTYPTGLDAFPNPGAATLEDAAGFYHDEQHANENDAIEAIQAKLGISETAPQDAPAANTVLQSLASGRSKWAKITSGMLAAGATLTKIGESVLASDTAWVDFDPIPSGYRGLRLRVVGRGTAALFAVALNVRFNGDSGANYDFQTLSASAGTAAGSESFAQTQALLAFFSGGSAFAGIASEVSAQIGNYGGGFQKSIITHAATKAGTATTNLTAYQTVAFWRNTAVITALRVFPASGNLAAGTTVTLYGEP